MDDLRRLLQLAYPHRWRLALATLIVVSSTAINLALPTQAKALFDAVFTEGNALSLNRITVFVVILLVMRMLAGVASTYLLEWVGERVVADLRQRLFSHLLYLDLNFFTHTRLGEITSRMTNDVAAIQGVVTSTLTNIIERVLLAGGALVIMLWLNWRLTLAIFITMPLVVLSSRLFGRKVYHLSREAQNRLAAANTVMEETLGAIRVVKSFAREPYEKERFEEEIEGLFRMARARARLTALFRPTATLLFMGALVFMLWLGGQEVLEGRLTVGEMFAFLMYATLISTSASVFVNAFGNFKKALGASERVFELLDRQPDIQSPPNGIALSHMRGEIRFENVSFQYEENYPIIEALNVTIQPGELIALVGVSGVGKSTLMNLIPRYYDVSAGQILIDGVDVRDADLPSLRARIASVPQETVLFADTVYQNLRYGRLDATEEEIMAAAKAANAHKFIMALPKGYQTVVGERGIRLSGGQRQRIAIARALIKEPAILLLDEATSSLDSESERAVQKALDELLATRNRTTLVIAHRLSTIRNADRILVLAPINGAGQIVEMGNHHELLTQRGVYYHLYMLQFQDHDPDLLPSLLENISEESQKGLIPNQNTIYT